MIKSLKHYFQTKENQISMRLDHVDFNLNNLEKLESEIAKKKKEVKDNVYVLCGNVQELIEQKQNELLKQIDDVYTKHSKKIEEHRQQVLEAQRNLLEAKQLANVVVVNTDIANANVDWDKYKEQFESSMNKTEQRIVWFNAMKLSSLQETSSLFNLDCDAITNTINRRMIFNYYNDSKKDTFELFRRIWDMLVEVGEDVAHTPVPVTLSTKEKQPLLNDYQFRFLMVKVAELLKLGTINDKTPTTQIRELITLLFAESREQEEPKVIPGKNDDSNDKDAGNTSSGMDKGEAVKVMEQRLEKLENFIASTFEKLNIETRRTPEKTAPEIGTAEETS